MRHGSSEDQIDSTDSMDSFASLARTECRSPSPSTGVDTSRLSELPSTGALPGSSQSRMAARGCLQGDSLPGGVPVKMTCLSSCRKSCLMIDGRRGLHESWRNFYCQRCRRPKDRANPKHDRRGAQDLPAKRGDCAQTPGRELAVIVDQCFISNTVNMPNPALLSSVNGLSQVQVLGLCPQ